MPRARPRYRKPDPSAIADEPKFDKRTLARLRAISSVPQFTEDVRALAWYYRSARRARAPDGTVLATLNDLERRVDQLDELLDALPGGTARLLEEAYAKAGSKGAIWDLKLALRRFAYAARYGQRRLKPLPGRPAADVEREAASDLRALFATYAIPFRPRAAIEFCLRLVLGLPESASVKRHLPRARVK